MTENLPSDAYKETRGNALEIQFTNEDLPWLNKEEVKQPVPLTLVTLKSGSKFYVGSAVRGKKLKSLANSLKEEESSQAQRQFYNHLPDFVENGWSSDIFNVEDPKSPWATYYVKPTGGIKLRTFFLRLDDISGLPAIIKIAVSRKSNEIPVLKEISRTRKER
ncbi:hypothetical protein A2714_01700 [Candidatus Woesebacteria bacterium RIFCSPHIGHO2_01_FULL_38_9]|uniref:Uncharacterized protein n=2 Tax=Candidatus Woeseibacteriota TaxID=1752722 RepID=A0A1F7XZE8_9BACT|nr:MAG: hypothetical protein A2714_01700 [Candidatus Woesebacteria bacterium RIFCSPHIGHO2_01_FULL_38_9]OGM59360.1 MAG: hypothetical protein A3A75_03345 [Candidatus Woesebacteria bacterium RIFCSPLOWO2_01_FULL_39_10]